MFTDLSDPAQRASLAAKISSDVDDYCINKFVESPRTHLGASEIGGECEAEMWFNFRWVRKEVKAGHMLRLLNRGHREEERFVDYLQGIGFEVREFDPETKEQFRISGSKGHLGGSLDSLMKPPERYGLDNMIWLGEFKTHNEKSFTTLAGVKPAWSFFKLGGSHAKRTKGDGVKKAKPQHFAQMSAYGRAYGYKYGLYLAVNKNTDELYFEIVELDWLLADDLFRKGDNVINSQERPMRLSNSPTFQYCKNLCDYVDFCHKGKPPTYVNCRSCKNGVPVEDKQWCCKLTGEILDKETIAVGCKDWDRIV